MGNIHPHDCTTRRTQANFDPERYSGLWYEQARLPTIYERGVKQASIEYEWDGSSKTMTMVNTIYGTDQRSIEGKAYLTHISGRLRVEFDGVSQGYYLIHDTDYDSYAIVGTPGGRYLWILSRDRYIQYKEPRWRSKMISKASRFGYPTQRLIWNKYCYSVDLEDVETTQMLYKSKRVTLNTLLIPTDNEVSGTTTREVIVQVIRGQIKASINGEEQEIEMGQLKVVPPKSNWKFVNETDDDAMLLLTVL